MSSLMICLCDYLRLEALNIKLTCCSGRPSLTNQLIGEILQTKELQGQVQELIDRGYIRESMSPCSALTLLVPKKDGTMRMFVDSLAINNITIKYRYPIPRLDDMLDELHGAKVFSRIDLRSGYHQFHMKDGDVYKRQLQ